MRYLIIENTEPYNNIIAESDSLEEICWFANWRSKKIANAPNETYIETIFSEDAITKNRRPRHWLIFDSKEAKWVTTSKQFRKNAIKQKREEHKYPVLEFLHFSRKHSRNWHDKRHGIKPGAYLRNKKPKIRHTMRMSMDDEFPIRPGACPDQSEFWDYRFRKYSKSWKDQSKRKHQYKNYKDMTCYT